jgi:hypothetical protein
MSIKLFVISDNVSEFRPDTFLTPERCQLIRQALLFSTKQCLVRALVHAKGPRSSRALEVTRTFRRTYEDLYSLDIEVQAAAPTFDRFYTQYVTGGPLRIIEAPSREHPLLNAMAPLIVERMDPVIVEMTPPSYGFQYYPNLHGPMVHVRGESITK